MNLNDIIEREIEDAERRQAAERESKAYDRELRRRVWRRRWHTIGDIIGLIVTLAFFVALCCLCCAASGYHWE